MSAHSAWRLLAASTCLSALVGCATTTPPLYAWDGYQPQVYSYLKSHGADSPQAQIAVLEEAEQKVRARGAALPPGYQAHLAMLYSKAGQDAKTEERLAAEKAQFPESAPFMDFLMRTFAAKGAR